MRVWQYSIVQRHFCHSWRKHAARSFSAMILLILLAVLVALAVAGVVGTMRALRNDGYRRIPTDWSRVP